MADTGFVTLVGAGPGDAGLLTLAGREALEQAEVVLYDRLAGPQIRAFIPAAAELIDVGKNKGCHPTPQSEINSLLLSYARQGKKVVRLKGGDPYLFGRGAEELELLRTHGIPFRVVPGITSAIAVPAYAGIPVTHREYSSSLHIITGHGKNGSAPDIPFAELARLRGTLVFLMGLSALPEITAGLLKAGMDPETPAALIENGTRPGQRRLVSVLSEIAARAEAFAPPAVFVVGKVCGLAEKYDWLSDLPLSGKKILAVSSQASASRLAGLLRNLGGDADEAAGIALQPLPLPDALWENLGRYQWIVLTSRFGAELFCSGMACRRIDARQLAGVRFAAVGPGTAGVLESRGIFPDLIPENYTAASLAEALGKTVQRGDRVLLFRARDAGRDADAALEKAGACAEIAAAYATAAVPLPESVKTTLAGGGYDLITFTSASAVRSFAASAPEIDFAALRVLCIGPATAAAAEACGMRPVLSEQPTLDSMAAAAERMGI